MKKLFTSAFLLFTLAANAQQVIFQETFNNFQGYQIYGWPQDLTGGPWETGWPDAIGSACYYPTDNPTKIAGITDSWACNLCFTCSMSFYDSMARLKTPPIDLTNISNAWLQYDSYFLGATKDGKTETAFIDVSANNGQSWTTVQQVIPDGLGFHRYYADLGSFGNNDSVRIGFRYNDGAGGNLNGWMIDNVKVFVPEPNDLALLHVTPTDSLKRYELVNTAILHQGKVLNHGTSTVTAFTLHYKKDNGPVYSYPVTGVQIAPFETLTITHPVPDTLFNIDKEKVVMWVSLPGDNAHQNDTAATYVHGAAFKPQKLPVIEEGTGTWNVWGPRGWTLMNQLPLNDIYVCQSAVHGAPDPMGNDVYDDYLYYMGNYFIPYLLVDRIRNMKPDSFFVEVANAQSNFGFAKLDLSGGMSGNHVWVNVNLHPAINLAGYYNLALLITEDSVRGTGADYGQKNLYAANQQGLGPMGGFENRPNPVPAEDMFYNFVARMIYPSPEGADVLPYYMLHQNVYSHTFTVDIDPSWNRDRLKAYVMLINMQDSTILNSAQLPWLLGVQNLTTTPSEYGLYPNPANDVTRAFFRIEQPENIAWTLTDISGKILRQQAATFTPAGRHEFPLYTSDLVPGIYILTVSSEHARQSMKITVIH